MKGKNNRPAMNEKIFEGIFDKSKSGEVTNIWREDLKNITESFEDIHKDDATTFSLVFFYHTNKYDLGLL